MFCPNCRLEYREGITECSDCGVELVDVLPPLETDAPPEMINYKEILSISSPGDIALIKGILEAEGIPHFFLGENYTAQFAGAARLMVDEERVADALDILKDYMEAEAEPE